MIARTGVLTVNALSLPDRTTDQGLVEAELARTGRSPAGPRARLPGDRRRCRARAGDARWSLGDLPGSRWQDRRRVPRDHGAGVLLYGRRPSRLVRRDANGVRDRTSKVGARQSRDGLTSPPPGRDARRREQRRLTLANYALALGRCVLHAPPLQIGCALFGLANLHPGAKRACRRAVRWASKPGRCCREFRSDATVAPLALDRNIPLELSASLAIAQADASSADGAVHAHGGTRIMADAD